MCALSNTIKTGSVDTNRFLIRHMIFSQFSFVKYSGHSKTCVALRVKEKTWTVQQVHSLRTVTYKQITRYQIILFQYRHVEAVTHMEIHVEWGGLKTMVRHLSYV